MKKITVAEVEYIAHSLAKKMMDGNEPISDFGTRYKGVLESCLGSINQTFAKKDLYPTLNKKAAALFYFMIKNHPFQNGNKRVAIMAMLYFLYKYGWWLEITNKRLYDFSKWVASSDPILKSQVINAIEEILKKYTVKKEEHKKTLKK